MKAHIFRDFSYTPSPITALASNHSTVAVFRRNKIVELIDSQTLKHFVRYNIEHTIVECLFIDINTLVCLSDCGKAVIFDIETLEKFIYDISAIHISAEFTNVTFAKRVFYYVTSKNEVCEWNNGVIAVIHCVSSLVSTLMATEHGLLIGTSDGWIRMYQKGSCVAEVNAKGTPIQMCRCTENDYAAVLSNGTAVLFDVENSVVFSTVEVRKSSLNAICYADGFVHISGEDSRIISYDVTSRRFIKHAQADFHVAEVKCMVLDNNRIISAGEDTSVVFNTLLNGRYICRKVYEDSLCSGTTNNYFYVTAGKFINIYSLNKSGSSSSNLGARLPSDDKITFQVSQHVLEESAQKETGILFFLRFGAKEAPVTVAISPDERYLAYSTSEETILYNLFQGSKLNIEKIRSFGPALQVVLTDKHLAVLELSKQLLVVELSTLETVIEVPFEDFRERVAMNESVVIMSRLKQIIAFSSPSNILPLNCEHVLGEIKANAFEISALTFDDLGGCMLGRIDEDKVVERRFEEEVKGTLSHTNANIFFSDRYLYVLEEERLKKYDIGQIINNVLFFKEDLIILQTSWNYLKRRFKPSVFKPKFGNR